MRKIVLVLVLLLAGAAIAVPFLVPIDSFIPQISSIASQKLGQPVSISDLKLHVLPTPRAVAYGITVGKRRQLRIAELEVVPALSTVFSAPWTIRLVRAEN